MELDVPAAAPPLAELSRNQPCVFFLRGRCRKGAKCTFSHAVTEARAAARPLLRCARDDPPPTLAAQVAPPPCKFYSQPGGCAKGASCPFAHDACAAAAPPPPPLIEPLPPAPLAAALPRLAPPINVAAAPRVCAAEIAAAIEAAGRGAGGRRDGAARRALAQAALELDRLRVRRGALDEVQAAWHRGRAAEMMTS